MVGPNEQVHRRLPSSILALALAVIGSSTLGCTDEPSPLGQRRVTDWYLGPPNPTMVIVEYGDYECPACSASHRAVQEVLRQRPDLGFVYRHLPSRWHPDAVLAAEAAEAAGAQGQFWAMHAKLYENQAEWYMKPDAARLFSKYAAELPLDIPRFESDLSSHRYRQSVANAKEAAQGDGVRNTPTIFVDGWRMRVGARSAAELTEALTRAEKRRRERKAS